MRKKLDLRAGAAALAALLAVTWGVTATAQIQPACPLTVDPTPTGPNQAPADQFADPTLFSDPVNSNDYHWIHSSTHLQGEATSRKFAPCLFYNPAPGDFPIDLSGMQSALVINNPNSAATTAAITWRDSAGNQVGAVQNVVVPAEGTWAQGALRLAGIGFGSAEINSTDQLIVGATLHHLEYVDLNGVRYTDPDALAPGANSMQQLQRRQDGKSTLYWGPVPVSNAAARDFLNGALPLHCVFNPNATATTVSSQSFLAGSLNPITNTVAALNPFGNFLDTSIWTLLDGFYNSNPGVFDVDLIVTASSQNGQPLIGEGILGDFYGDGPGPNPNLVPGGRFRMASHMMSTDPVLRLTNPELIDTQTTATPPVTTNMAVMNVTAQDIGPVRVEYFSRTGASLGNAVVAASFPAGAAARILPTFGGQVFAGWARITACRPGLVGWTVREVQPQTGHSGHFVKTYGEVLDGGNDFEPGDGFPWTDGLGTTWVREVSPLLRTAANNWSPNWWPSYSTAVNDSVPNLGPYWWRFFNLGGVGIGSATFTGLRWANTSYTYEDPITSFLFPPAAFNGSGRFDHLSGTNKGIDAIGDPIAEWQIPWYPDPPIYTGPGDVVPIDH